MNSKRRVIDFLEITIIYCLTHGFLLILHGWWWDDYANFFMSSSQLWDTCLQLGRPVMFYLMSLGKILPANGLRIVTFFLLYICTLCFWGIVRRLGIGEQKALVLTLLYIVIPTNDARAVSAIFPYTAGYSAFIIATFMLVQSFYLEGENIAKKRIQLRLVSEVLFFFSFTTNSCLVFYSIPLLYIFLQLYRNKSLKSVYKYADFTVIPFIYYFFKTTFFPAYGIYAGYNTVTWIGIEKAVFKTIPAVFISVKDIIIHWFVELKYVGGLSAFLFLVFFLKKIWEHHGGEGGKDVNRTQNNQSITVTGGGLGFLLGLAILYMGLLPYVVIGRDIHITQTGVGGRDSLLVSVGASIVIFVVVELFIRSTFRWLVYVTVILCGIAHFNYWYLSYQQDYYRQMDLTYEIKENKEILKERKTILYTTDFEPDVLTTRFYSLNRNMADAMGDETHFVIYGLDMSILRDESYLPLLVNNACYQMSGYRIKKNITIDAVVYYHDSFSLSETLKLKFLELFNRDAFKQEIYHKKNLQIFLPGTEQYESLVESD